MLPPLLPELTRPPRLTAFRPNLGDIVGGLVSSVIAIAYGLTFADLIFSGPLKPWGGYGLAATFVTMAVIASVMAARSTIPFVIAGPDGATAAVTATLVASLVTKLYDIGPPDDIFAPVMILIALTTVTTGVFLWIIGAFRLGNAIRYIPYPVIGGFLATTGWLLISGGVRIVSERSPGSWLFEAASFPLLIKVGAAALFAAALSLAQRIYRGPYVLPGVVVCGVILAHLGLHATGADLDHGQVAAWFVTPRPVAIVRAWGLDDLRMFPWEILPSLSGDILAMVFVTVVTMLLNINGIEILTKREVDLQPELKSIGWANILSAAGGGYIGCTSINRTTLNYLAGGRGRLSGLVVAFVSAGILMLGDNFVSYIPKYVLGGLVMNLGAGLMWKWAFVSARTLPRIEYAILVLVFLVNLKYGFIAGVGVGVISGCATFAYNASRTNIIKFTFDGAEYGSSLDRSSDELAILSSRRDEIRGFVLHGHLFFGSANRLYEEVKAALAANKDCKFLIFDFSLVNGVDSSAAHSFRQISLVAKQRGVKVVFFGAEKAIFDHLRSVANDVDIHTDSLDHTIERCENDVIARHLVMDDDERDFASWLTHALGDAALAKRMSGLCHRLDVDAGEIVARQNDSANCMHFILRGRLGIIVQLKNGASTRVRSLGRHTTVGEMGLLTGGPRSATIRAETASVIYQLDLDAYEHMKRADPALSQALLTYVISVMAQRLRMASNTIAILRR